MDWLGALPPEIRSLVESLQEHPNFSLHLVKLAEVLRIKARTPKGGADELAIHAWEIAPGNPRVRYGAEWAMGQRVPRWHFSMANDTARSAVYKRALALRMQPGMTVLEIGAGSGILAMLAAQAGAEHVYACEMEPLVAGAAVENVRRNGLSECITIIPKKSTDVHVGIDLPEKADLIVSEIVSNSLLSEEVLPTYEDAVARLIKPGAVFLPTRITLRGALVGGPEWTSSCRLGLVHGFDLSALNSLAPPVVKCKSLNLSLETAVSVPVELFAFDLATGGPWMAETKEIAIPVTRTGVVDGLLQWIWMGFGDEICFENAPPYPPHSWAPMLHVFPESIPVEVGQVITLHIEHNRHDFFAWRV
jgi:type II protein arginine methyltransferase